MTESTGYYAYHLYNSLKLHFSLPSYDFIKYNGKSSVSKESFMLRKDKYSFHKISRKYNPLELRDFYIANFVYGNSTWIGELLTAEAEMIYKKYLRIHQGLTYSFENDIVYLFDKYEPEQMLIVRDGYPPLFEETMQEGINLETLAIMNDIMGFFPTWTKRIQDDVIFPTWKMKCEKYIPFIHYDKPKFKNILKEKVKEYEES